MTVRNSRGFSLLELILAGLIMAVVAGFGLFSLTNGRQGIQSRGLAEEIAEELKAARQQAIAKGIPVALAFPSGGRSTGQTQSFYRLEGASRPRVVSGQDYSKTYPESCFFWGQWGGSTPESLAPSDSETEFDLLAWSPLPVVGDHVLVFTPQGTVKSYGLPVFSGEEYRLLVSNGVQETGGSPSSPLAVSKPHTVRIGKTGSVTVFPGVYGATIAEATDLTIGNLPNSLPPVSPPTGGPAIARLRVEPEPKELSDGGAVAIVPDEGFVTLVCEAQDVSGGPLTMEWVARPRGSASGTGMFSSEKPVTMTWDPKYMSPGPDPYDPSDDVPNPCWVGKVNWTPPKDAADGDLYDLICTVRNPRGGDDEQQLGANASVEVVLADRVACVNTDSNWEKFYIAWMNPEGASVVGVTLPDAVWDQLTPVWSPNGTKLAFYQAQEEPPNSDQWEARLYVVNDDGTGLKKMYTCHGDFADYSFGPSFAPDGSQVCFSNYLNEDYRSSRVWRCDIFGEPDKVQLTAEGPTPGFYWDHSNVAWNPVYQKWILYAAVRYRDADDAYQGSAICVYNVWQGSHPNPRTPADTLVEDPAPGNPNEELGEPHWSNDGRKIVYYKGKSLCYRTFNPDTGTVGAEVDITPGIPGFDAKMPRFSPQDDRVAVVNYVDDSLHVIEDLTPPVAHHKVFDDFGGVWGYNWSADATEFVLSVWNNENVYTVPDSGGDPQNITPPGFTIWSTPSWWAR